MRRENVSVSLRQWYYFSSLSSVSPTAGSREGLTKRCKEFLFQGKVPFRRAITLNRGQTFAVNIGGEGFIRT